MRLGLKHAAGARVELGTSGKTFIDGRQDFELSGKSGVEIAAELRRRKSTPAARLRSKNAADIARRERDLARQVGPVTRK